MPKYRIALGVEYCGANYHGWQRQLDLHTVQQQLENALTSIADEPISVFCAGRTDTGVHAVGQVVHFETTANRDWQAWVFGANTKLPKDINVRWARVVDDNFHARFSAIAREYRYLLYNANARCSILSERMTWHYAELNLSAMQIASECLIGEHDFSAYRALGCQAKSPIRHMEKISITQQGQTFIFDFKADGFLYHMIRNMVGVLMAIGAGKAETSWSKTVLESKDRRLGGVTAPPYGLYFVNAYYPEDYAIPVMRPPLLVL